MATKVTRQRVGGSYVGPYGPSPVTHVSYSEARHLHPERLPSGRKDKAVSLRLLDVSKETMVNVQKVSPTVKRLMAAGLKLKAVPEEIVAPLINLTKLDLANNQLGDGSLPESIKNLEHLLEVRLNQNQMTRIPACLKKLKNLTRLDMSDNQMELATGLEKLRKIRMLVLDNNKLTSVFKEISGLKKLEVFLCKGNQLREIPRDIRQLKHLVDLDVSDNNISIMPTDVFLLPRLDVFNCSQNEITKVPSFNVRPQNKHWVSTIDLSDNKLSKFPGHLLLMSSKLDLSGNRIRSLSYNVMKKLDANSSQELVLDDNPLHYPPLDVCESGLKNILSFFQESQAEVKVYQGVKVLVVGSYRSGKTSLVQTMVDQQPRMSEEIQDTSAGIESYEMSFDLEEEDVLQGRPGKSLQLNVWDFCGHPFYMYPHYAFFEQPTITILTFSMADYKSELFEEQIGSWFDWMIAKTNKIVVILVGTQCDRVHKSQIPKIAKEVRTKLAEHIDRQSEMTKSRIRAIEERPHISPTLSEQLKAYMKLLQAKFTVQTDVITTSSKSYTGLDRLRQAIELLAADRNLFPNVMRVIPTFWVDVENYIEERGNALTIPVLTWDQFQEEVTERFGMKHLMKSIAQYLHETGKVLWFPAISSLKDHVFIRPSWLFDVFRAIVRHDFEDAVFTSDDAIRSAGITSARFERLKQEYLSDGVLDRDLIRCVMSNLIPTDIVSASTEVMRLLSQAFELGYPITKKQRDSVYSLFPDKDGEGKTKLGKILIPWLRRKDEPRDFVETWDSMKENRKLGSFFRFPHYLPPGLFDITTVRACGDKHKLKFAHHWGGGVHAVHTKENVHVVISYFSEGRSEEEWEGKEEEEKEKRGGPKEDAVMVKYELRDAAKGEEEEPTPAATMWSILLPLLMDFEELLSSYAGILVERLTECPHCLKPSFLGEWLTPKETQALATRPCENCGEEVDTALLVQPREKKRDDILRDIMRKARQGRRTAAGTKELDAISKVAPRNPRKVNVAYPELDMEEGLKGILGGSRSNSLGTDSEQDDSSRRGSSSMGAAVGGGGSGSRSLQARGFLPLGLDIDAISRLNEIRKRSMQVGVSSDGGGEEDEIDFFVTHQGEEDNDNDNNVDGDGDDSGGGGGGSDDDVWRSGSSSGSGSSGSGSSGSGSSVSSLPGLEEFRRRLGLVHRSSREGILEEDEGEDGNGSTVDDEGEGHD